MQAQPGRYERKPSSHHLFHVYSKKVNSAVRCNDNSLFKEFISPQHHEGPTISSLWRSINRGGEDLSSFINYVTFTARLPNPQRTLLGFGFVKTCYAVNSPAQNVVFVSNGSRPVKNRSRSSRRWHSIQRRCRTS